MNAFPHHVRLVRANNDALPACNTPFGEVAELWVGVLAFGVMAPRAVHRTSLEKDRRADARAIVQREALDVEDNTCSIHCDTVREGLGINCGGDELKFSPPRLIPFDCLLLVFQLRFKRDEDG